MEKYKITFDKIKCFGDYLIFNEKSINTVEKYVRDVTKFAEFAKDKEITKETVIDYKEYLTKNYKIRSVNSMLASLNGFFEYENMREFKVKPIKFQQQIFCTEDKELTKNEYEKLCRTAEKCNKKLSLILQTICSTGIRVSEIKYFTVESVRKGIITVTNKGKTRTVFIVKELQKKLLRYTREQKTESGLIFIDKTGRAISRVTIWRWMKNICAVAGVDSKKVYPHNLRHLFARMFYRLDKDIAKLADILGHSSINTTRIYIVSTGEEHRRKMESLHLVI